MAARRRPLSRTEARAYILASHKVTVITYERAVEVYVESIDECIDGIAPDGTVSTSSRPCLRVRFGRRPRVAEARMIDEAVLAYDAWRADQEPRARTAESKAEEGVSIWQRLMRPNEF
jgi:hypothetical protein